MRAMPQRKRPSSPVASGSGIVEKRRRQVESNSHVQDTTDVVLAEREVCTEEDEFDLSQQPDFYINPGAEAEVGIIEKVSLKNFMCHSYLEFNFCPQVNFIIGRNGSGKSAVLTAIVIGLGGKATVTNRGTSVKGFIKTGKGKAEILVRLRNQGQDAYKPHLYGKAIMIERHLTREGSTSYKLKAEDGKLVSSKREELNHILDSFNIQVDNPVAVLNQDCSRNFLNSKNAQDKYRFFLKATQLEQLKSDYVNANDSKVRAHAALQQKKQMMPALEQEVMELEEQYKASKAVTGLQERVKHLKDEQAWAIIVKAEKDLEQNAKEVRVEESRVPKFLNYIKRYENEQSELKTKQGTLQAQIQESCKEAAGLESKHKESKTSLNEAKIGFRNAQMEMRKFTSELKNMSAEHKAILDRIEEIKNTAKQDYESERLIRERKIAELEELVTSYTATHRTTEHELEQFQATVTKYKEDQYKLRTDDREFQRQIDYNKQKLYEFEAARQNRMKRFGHWMPDVLAEIEEHHRRGFFHKKPRGPLGAYLDLKDPKWALSIESCLKSLMHAFTVHDHHDERKLEAIFSKVCPEGKKPATITAPFTNEVYDVSQYRAQTRKYMAVLDVLKVKDPVVANCLIDQRSIENVLLIEKKDEARQVMLHDPPRNVREAFTIEGDQVYALPIFRYYSNIATKANILTSSVEENVRFCQEKITQLNAEKQQVVNHQRDLDAQIRENQRQANACQTRLNRLRTQISNVNMDLTELREKEDPAPVDITTLEDEAQHISSQIAAHEEKKKEAENHLSEQKSNVVAKDEAFKALDDRLNQLAECTEPFREQRAQLDDKIAEVEGYRTHYVQKKKEHDKKLGELKSKFDKQKTKLEEDTVKANQICSRIETRRSADNIESEIRQIQKQITKREEKRGNHEEIARKYHELKESYKHIMTEVNQLTNFLKALDGVMDHRQKQYFEFRKMIAVRVKYFFILMLSNRNYTGKLTFNHQKELLTMSVTPNNTTNGNEGSKDMKSLSGGERSFATVCFILALWDAMESPFRCLDEFDVFMDLVNRRIAMEMMLEVASQQKERQFIFLTPLELSKLKIDHNISVFRMPDPDRGQGTINFRPAVTTGEEGEQEEE